MKRAEIIEAVCEAALLPAASVQAGDALRDVAGWDSLAGVDFQRIVAERWGIELDGMRVSEAGKVSDLIGLLAGQIED